MFSFLIFLCLSVVRADTLAPGDVVLLPLKCYICRAIEIETDSPWAHSGIVLQDDDGRLFVAHAGDHVIRESVEQFWAKSAPGQTPAVYRARAVSAICQNKRDCAVFSQELLARFRDEFEGLSFDHDFRWDNFDESGKEKLYCSEFVAKLLSPFMESGLPPRPLTFNRLQDFWNSYFKGQVPEGIPGNAPADFARSSEFQSVFVN
jgi:hypothetical protein